MKFILSKRFLLSTYMIAITFVAFGQQITITGVVKDSLGGTLDMANVVAINQETKTLDGFGITDPNGRYKVNVKSNTTYSLKFSYLGFQPMLQEYLPPPVDHHFDPLRDLDLLDNPHTL